MSVARRALLVACAALPVLVPMSSAHAQEPPFPQRGNVEITVLFPAGTSADVTARLLAEGISRHLGQTVLVVNRPGAGGAIGYKYVASQKPDGYSLVWNSNSISTTYHSGQLAFDYRAFDPVARVLVESPVVAVRGDAKWKSLGDLMADAKARPGIITVGNSGIGSHTHISSVALFHAAGVTIVDVPYAAGAGGAEPARRPRRRARAAPRRARRAGEVRQRAPARDDDPRPRPGAARRADREGAGDRRLARSVAWHRRAARDATSDHCGARERHPPDRREPGLRAVGREARRAPGLHAGARNSAS